MAHEFTLEVKKREATGKGAAKRLRREGGLPAILYSKDHDPCMLELNYDEWFRATKNISLDGVLVNLKIAGESPVESLVKDIQKDHLTGMCKHVDFHAIERGKPIHTELHVEVQGEAEGVSNQGGILDFSKRSIEIECLPKDIPGEVKLDITELKIHDAITAGDLDLGPAVKILTDPETVLVHVLAPKAEPEVEPEEEEGSAEPELIRKERKAEEEEGGEE